MTEISKLTVGIKVIKCNECDRVKWCQECIHNDPEAHIPGLVYCNFYDCTKDFDGYCDEAKRRSE